MTHLSAEAKHPILLEYQAGDNTRSFAALARCHAVKGGGPTIGRWHSRWDGSPASLQERARSGRPRALSAQQVARHIRAPILAANRAHRAIHYPDLLDSVRTSTGADLSLPTLRRYGKEGTGAKQQRGKKRTAEESECTHTAETGVSSLRRVLTCFAVSASLCDDIATLRRKLQRIDKRRLLFLDETALRLSAAPNSTLVLPGEQPLIEATDTSSYAARYDMIAVCTGDRVLLPKIFTPKERKGADVRGINGAMLLQVH
jgi:hypothetical protein